MPLAREIQYNTIHSNVIWKKLSNHTTSLTSLSSTNEFISVIYISKGEKKGKSIKGGNWKS